MRSPRSALALALVSVLVGASSATAATPHTAVPDGRPAASEVTRVVAISVDGLNPDAIVQLGATGTPTFHRLMSQGAWTFNARTEVEQTVTLPNHTGMVTSRRIERLNGGHGVTWDDDRLVPRTVQAAAGHPVASVFSELKQDGLSSAMFASKTKFSLYTRSWPGMGRSVVDRDSTRLVRKARRDLATTWRAFTWLHISLPDLAGHAHGWMSPAYLTAVRQTDTLIGRVLATIDKTAESKDHTLVVVTADHGGLGRSHSNAASYADYRIPFMVWGPGVPAGQDLYGLNPTYADPGTRRVGYAVSRQPVRNGDLGNLALDVLGLPPIPKSELDYAQDLEVLTP
jgi:hypothetical protein